MSSITCSAISPIVNSIGLARSIGTGSDAGEAVDQVIDETEGAGLRSLAIYRDVFPPQSLKNEIRDDAAIIRGHPRAVGVEYANEPDVDLIELVEVGDQGFRASAAFAVTGASAKEGVVPAFRLRVELRIAVGFRCRRLQDARAAACREFKQIQRALHMGLHRTDRIGLAVGWRCRAGKIIDFVDLEIDWFDNVVRDDMEGVEAHQRFDIAPQSGREIVDANDLMSRTEKSLAEMGSKKTRSTGDEDCFLFIVVAQRNASVMDSCLRVTRTEFAQIAHDYLHELYMWFSFDIGDTFRWPDMAANRSVFLGQSLE
jgi:hypothetical protein